MTSTAVRYVNVSFDAARGEAKLEVNESAFEGGEARHPREDGQVGALDLQIERRGEGGGARGWPLRTVYRSSPRRPRRCRRRIRRRRRVKMQSAQRGMAARRMSKELAASAVVKEAAIDLVVEKGEGVPLGLTLRNSPAQPGQPGPQEEGGVVRQGGDAVLARRRRRPRGGRHHRIGQRRGGGGARPRT